MNLEDVNLFYSVYATVDALIITASYTSDTRSPSLATPLSSMKFIVDDVMITPS